MNPELAALQNSIQDLHQLMTVMGDPGHTAIVAQCLKALTGIQKEMMTQQGGGAAQQGMVQNLTGGQPQQGQV